MRLHLVPLVLLVAGTTAFAQTRTPGMPAAPPASPPSTTPSSGPSAAPVRETAPAEDRLVDSTHAVQIGGSEVRYTATTGTLALRNAAGKATASIFFVAYTRNGVADARTRPLTFAYNGGPGAASIWLHMGALGPKRVKMAADGFQPAPPFELVDNAESLLDVTDLVMIDPVSTGYSRAADGENPNQFHGVRPDIESVSDFIRLYTTRFKRWPSPKYLLGESYGTLRSAGVAEHLQSEHGIELNGVILVSSILDWLTRGFVSGNDLPYAAVLPTLTATAWYHKRLPADLQQAPIAKVVEEARQFAFGEYLTTLAKGNALTPDQWKAAAAKVARFTGLPAAYVEQANLRVTDTRFRKELLRDKRLTVGRLDGRFTGFDADAAGETQEYDPSNTAIEGAYTALFNDYVRRELKWETDLPYQTSGNVRPWSFTDYQNRYLNLSESLRAAMARNPYLRVLVANGYYDMATPFAATEWTFAHLGFDPTYRQRVAMTYYEGGHMMYLHPGILRQLKEDVAAFITSTKESRAPATNQ